MKTKFNEGDNVRFVMPDENGVEQTICGTVYIVDRLGTYFNPNEPHYDIMVGYVLYKHIPESWVEANDV